MSLRGRKRKRSHSTDDSAQCVAWNKRVCQQRLTQQALQVLDSHVGHQPGLRASVKSWTQDTATLVSPGMDPSMQSSTGKRRSNASSSRSRKARSTNATDYTSSFPERDNTKITDTGVKQLLDDNGIFSPEDSEAPSNLEALKTMLATRRPSLSPSRCDQSQRHRDFYKANLRATNEATFMTELWPELTGGHHFHGAVNVGFTNLQPICDGLAVLPPQKPDRYDAALARDIDSDVRKDLDQYLLPSPHRSLALPSFALEAKSRDGPSGVALNQAIYDGAAGARSMFELRNWPQVQASPTQSRADTIVYTYVDGTLRGYSTHAERTMNNNRTMDYHNYQLIGVDMTDSDSYLRGLTALRNSREYCQSMRDSAIREANVRAQLHRKSRVAMNTTVPSTCNTYATADSCSQGPVYERTQDDDDAVEGAEASEDDE